MIEKIEQRAFALYQSLWCQQVLARYAAKDWGRREIAGGHAHDGECGVVRVDAAKFAS